ncbi:MAG: hypothetical protein PWQ57_2676 [Desulfovibrionales bacterium]|nr:hypothetical protein [Desulfovibrionales bacterium]
MAPYKRKDGRWQVGYRDNGRVRTRTFPPGRVGKRQAAEFEAEVRLKKARQEPLPEAPREGSYLDEIMQAWIVEKKAQGRAAGWLKNWASVFNSVFLPTLCTRPAHKISQADVMAVISAHYTDASQATRNRYIGYLKSALAYAVEQGMLRENPLGKWRPGKEQRRVSRLTLDDLKRISSESPAYLAWAIEVAWNIPVRPGADLFGLRFDVNVRYDRNGVEVFHAKVGKSVFVVCSETFMRELYAKETQHQSGHLIEYKGSPVSDLGNGLALAARRADLRYSPCMYDIRHLWITTMLDEGFEPSVIAHLAGTSVRMILKNYYEPHAVEKASIADSIPSLAEAPKDADRKVVGITEARTNVVQKRCAKKGKGSRS